MKPDTLINARWVIPVDAQHSVLEHHALVIQAGRILDILPSAEAAHRYDCEEQIDLPDHALIPGLINAHTHAAMCLLRGLADDLPLMEWLTEHIWPAESRWVNADFVYDGTRLAIAEMLLSGTTCFNDMYFFPDVTARAAAAAGIRATVGLIVLDFPTVWAHNADEYISRGLAVHDQYRNHALIRTAFAPHAPYSVSDGPLEKIRTLADELNLPVHMHVHETRSEIEQSIAHSGKHPIARLEELGILCANLLAVHMTQLDANDKQQFADCGGHVIHCPESNLKLASGFCPVSDLLELGVNVAIGTDGAASNNDLDMFGEMRTAALLAKGLSGYARAVPAATALQMATLNGARALGIDQETGSLKIGKSADIVAVDLSHAHTQPTYNPVSQIVYACGRDNVTDVWVAGKRLVSDRLLTTLDWEEVSARARAWGAQIAQGQN